MNVRLVPAPIPTTSSTRLKPECQPSTVEAVADEMLGVGQQIGASVVACFFGWMWVAAGLGMVLMCVDGFCFVLKTMWRYWGRGSNMVWAACKGLSILACVCCCRCCRKKQDVEATVAATPAVTDGQARAPPSTTDGAQQMATAVAAGEQAGEMLQQMLQQELVGFKAELLRLDSRVTELVAAHERSPLGAGGHVNDSYASPVRRRRPPADIRP